MGAKDTRNSGDARERLLTEPEAARYLRVARRTLQRWRQLGKGPPYVRAGRRILYRVRDLDAWLEGGNPPGGQSEP